MNFKTRESLLQDIKTKITLKDPPKELMRDRSAPQISRRKNLIYFRILNQK